MTVPASRIGVGRLAPAHSCALAEGPVGIATRAIADSPLGENSLGGGLAAAHLFDARGSGR